MLGGGESYLGFVVTVVLGFVIPLRAGFPVLKFGVCFTVLGSLAFGRVVWVLVFWCFGCCLLV